MPSERFYKLKQVKKRTFLKMAYKEFALHSYEGASITRLMGDLKMAKGSIYQYFEDKQDLYLYLVEHAHQQLHDVVRKTCPAPHSEDDFNAWFSNLLLIQLKFLMAVPAYTSLFIKHSAEYKMGARLSFMEAPIEEASRVTNTNIPIEKAFYLNNLPFLVFDFILQSEKIDLYEIIKSDSSIVIPTDKLLYLCEAFFKKA